MRYGRWPLLALIVTALTFALFADEPPAAPPKPELRKQAHELQQQGNWAEALAIYRKLLESPGGVGGLLASDLNRAVQCLRNLGQIQEFDAMVEKAVEVHGDEWRVLQQAANEYMQIEHYGFIVAGEFERGHHRGGGEWANAFERDRVRALQLMQEATRKAREGLETHKAGSTDLAALLWQFAEHIRTGHQGHQAWRLQYLTDLTTLPDYEKGYYGHGGGTQGAPVDAEGDPVFYEIPRSFEDAQSDGERWRWLMMEAAELNPALKPQALLTYAQFLHQQFGVQTMAYYGRWGFGATDEDDKADAGPFAVHTLSDDETIARLATGIKRFDLPEGHNFIAIYKELAGDPKFAGRHETQQAIQTLAQIYENRRQYPTAVTWWEKYRAHNAQQAEQAIKQITGNWAQFEPIMMQPAGQGAQVDLRFRNGKKITFTAHTILVDKLLQDVKDYIKGNPKELDWQKTQLENIGYRLVTENQQQYLGPRVAEWSLDLDPRQNHWDKLVTVTTPLQKAGAYLLTGQIENGNTARIVLWLADTALVRKPGDGKAFYYVADAVTGVPVARANVEFFGFRFEYQRGRHQQVIHRNFAEFTDQDGILNLPAKRFEDEKGNSFNWLVVARTDDGRLAYQGFDNAWVGHQYDREYNQVKGLVITDRPVYRPDQKVQWKAWMRHARYDQKDVSAFAGRSFMVRIHNAKGEMLYEQQHKADEYGGVSGELTLKADAALGVYSLSVDGPGHGQGNFRVEEYKKPEFEVTVEAPEKPVMLGETIDAVIKAKYYFGSPVTEAKVKYKVLRHEHDARWYPVMPWDWFYGSGYWWFAYDYEWWPGWKVWGVPAPRWSWWGGWSNPQPEVVAEGEAEIGEDGTFKIKLDTTAAKELHGDTDHRYEITAEVTDKSRRTIVGTGKVLVARQPFKVYAWVDRGFYRVGDTVHAFFQARTLDGRGVQGKGKLTLYSVTYDQDRKPIETPVQTWDLNTDDTGSADQQLQASRPGQYRLSYELVDEAGHSIVGGYVFVVRGEGFDGEDYRFDKVEIVPDKTSYAPGEVAKLMINADRPGTTVLLFVRAANGVYPAPRVLRLDGKSTTQTVEISLKDMPNLFVEALTVFGGKAHTTVRELTVPPEERVLGMSVTPDKTEYLPGEKATVTVKLTGPDGEPFVGSTVLAVYDKALEYISGGSNVPDIKEFFWKWRRSHHMQQDTNLQRFFHNLLKQGEEGMTSRGVFGDQIVNEIGTDDFDGAPGAPMRRQLAGGMVAKSRSSEGPVLYFEGMDAPMPATAPTSGMALSEVADMAEPEAAAGEGAGGGAAVQPAVRTAFADTAFWAAALTTDADGVAQVTFDMPENLTGWKVKGWAMGHGTKVGEAAADVVTRKNIILRLQAPRFFVQTDEVVLSANIHNYLKDAKDVQAVLELDGNVLLPLEGAVEIVHGKEVKAEHMTALIKSLKKLGVNDVKVTPADLDGDKVTFRVAKSVSIKAGGEARVDWRVRAMEEGTAVVRMKALTDVESDAMEMTFPTLVHGFAKQIPQTGVIRPETDSAKVTFSVPAERRIDQSRLELRFSPSLAMAMVDALPYLAEYPYGCTEQTLNRFLPTVITQKTLQDIGVDLAEIRKKKTNLNAQEIGDPTVRAAQWEKRHKVYDPKTDSWIDANPVWDGEVVSAMVKQGVEDLTKMQLSDGGWGWFSGWGEHSWPHTTAVVVHGLQIAQENDVALVPGVLERGLDWLARYQAEQLQLLENGELPAEKRKDLRWKDQADALDALVYMVLVDGGRDSQPMLGHLYKDRNGLPVYAKAMLGLAVHKIGDIEKRDMLLRNIEQYVKKDDENHTAWLELGNESFWWYWYGSEMEAHAFYLKLLAKTQPQSDLAPRLVKYLLNNRKHATYWNSTRDTAYVIEAFADYIRASGESEPDMTVQVVYDGKPVHEVKITRDNLFTFDNTFVLVGDAVEEGQHTLELRRTGKGPVYFSAYLDYFTLEDFITKAGMEIKVERSVYRLNPVEKTIKVAGARGQALDQKVEKYEREKLENLATLKSGDLVEVELEIASKNDYEYIIFEDMKAAGMEPVDVRSGYTGNAMGAYVEFRDQKVAFFVRALARGNHSVSYRLRAEIPGKFSALPASGYAMYAPELKANSDEIKLKIED